MLVTLYHNITHDFECPNENQICMQETPLPVSKGHAHFGDLMIYIEIPDQKLISQRTDVQGQIYALATALGVKPADLSSAIRPLIDPTVPNPADACQKELELVKLQLATGAGAGGAEGTVGSNKVDEKAAEGSLLGLAAEALLD